MTIITDKHLDWMARITLVTGLIVLYGYVLGDVLRLVQRQRTYERALVMNRIMGPYAFFYWALIVCNGVVPQLFWMGQGTATRPHIDSRLYLLSASACGWSGSLSSP